MTTERKMPELGKIEKVDIKEIWHREDENFTPWLAENISELGEALGLDLEAQEQEAPVGTFRLDVLASEAGTDNSVIIENQYGDTDHTHLGQLLTYAAGHDAKVVVWIAEGFREEHRAALELLNNRTDEDTKFFGVRIEAWTIDDSRPAPRFDVVVTPNSWTKEVKKAGVQGDEKFREFFQPLVDTLRDDHKFTNKTKAATKQWESFSSGHARLRYNLVIRKKTCQVELYITRSDKDLNKEIYDDLHEQKDAIESEIGKPLHWQRLDNRIASRISIIRDGGIDDEDMHDEIREWMVDRLLKFKEVFDPKLGPILAELGSEE